MGALGSAAFDVAIAGSAVAPVLLGNGGVVGLGAAGIVCLFAGSAEVTGATIAVAGSNVLGGSHPFHPTSAVQFHHSGRKSFNLVMGANSGE